MKKPYRALITGASSGLGAAFARNLAAKGAHLILTARRTEQLNQLAEQLRQNHLVEVEVVTIDLTQPETSEVLFEAATKDNQEIDMLINCAGAGPYRPFMNTPMKDHLAILQLNSVALTGLCHLFAEHMLKHGKPSWILNVASVAAFQPIPKFAVYCGSKSYVRVFSEIFSHEMRETNVTVSCLCPGGTATEFLEANNQQISNAGKSFLMTAKAVAEIGIQGTLRGDRVIVPGVMNKMACMISKVLPSSVNVWLSEKSMNVAVSESDQNGEGN